MIPTPATALGARAITGGGLAAAVVAGWAISHYALIDKGKDAVGL